MVCTLSFGEISNIHDGLHIRLASALLSVFVLCVDLNSYIYIYIYIYVCIDHITCTFGTKKTYIACTSILAVHIHVQVIFYLFPHIDMGQMPMIFLFRNVQWVLL